MFRLADFHCSKCDRTQETLSHENEVVRCEVCGAVAQKLPPIVRVNMGPVPIGGHYDETLETFVRNKQHRQEVMDQQGVFEKGGTPKNGARWV